MFPELIIGSLTIPTAGVVLVVGVLASVELAGRTGHRYGVSPDREYILAFTAIASGIIGARLVYAAQHLRLYLQDPGLIVALGFDALSGVGGLFAASLSALLYIRWRQMPVRRTLDSVAAGLALFAVAIGVAHLARGTAFGAPADLPWAVELWDARRHPTQVYEIASALLLFLVTCRLRSRTPFPGFLFGLWLTLAASSHLLLENYRGDSIIVADNVRQEQLVALGVALFGLWLLGHWSRMPKVTQRITPEN